MNTFKVLMLLLLACTASAFNAQAQYKFKFLFQGTCYQTNGTGNVVATPITEQTLLQDRAQAGGRDVNTLALVYHVGGDPKGDTVEVVNTDGSFVSLQFGFWFADDPTLLRAAMTNFNQTEELRLDYIYTLETSTYLSPNSHSMGSAFTTKRFDSNHVPTAIFGPLRWIVNASGASSTKVINGAFSIGAPYP